MADRPFTREQINCFLGPRIKKKRKEAGYTAMSFAEEVDLSVRYYLAIERGTDVQVWKLLLRF